MLTFYLITFVKTLRFFGERQNFEEFFRNQKLRDRKCMTKDLT